MSLSRRTLLRGAGAAMALPFLEAMMPRALAGSKAPALRRLAVLYVPNGVHMQDWRPSAEGGDFALPWILEPLEAHRKAMTIYSGFVAQKAFANGDGPGDHARAAAAFLTGVQPNKRHVQVGVSIDQAIARRIGTETRLSSLAIGIERGALSGNCDSGYPCAYSSNVSWSGASTPCLKEVDPGRVFDSLFRDPMLEGGSELRRTRRSILDLVRGESKSLAKNLSGADRARLEQYEEGVRAIEKRIQKAGDRESHAPDGLERPELERGTAYPERLDQMIELAALALITGSTPVLTFMLANEGSNRSYPNLEIAEGHHSLSHHGKDPLKFDAIRRINRFHSEALARLLDRLAESGEPVVRCSITPICSTAAGSATATATTTTTCPCCTSPPRARATTFCRCAPICDLYLGLAWPWGHRSIPLATPVRSSRCRASRGKLAARRYLETSKPVRATFC
ncbi:MAG: DUF1552 domain-containing protein [Planctomycetota bacterium]